MMDCDRYRELVAADIDRQLAATDTAAAAAHVAGCPRCARLRQEQQVIKDLLRLHRRPVSPPESVRTRILDAVAREATTSSAPRSRRGGRLVLGGAIAALLLLSLVPWWRQSGPELLDVLVRDVHAATADEIALTPADNIEALRRLYSDSGRLAFRNTVVDLTALGFRPTGGAVVPIGDVAATFTVYESPHGKMICRRFAVGAIDLPAGGEPFDGAQLFRIDGITIRIVRDGDAICCFASDIPYDTLIAYLERARHH
jgi:anti-sigma factor RsiW